MNRIVIRIAVVAALATVLVAPVFARGNRGELPVSEVEVNKGSLPIVDEPFTMEVGVITNRSSGDIEGQQPEYFRIMEERTNVSIDWKVIPADNTAAKLILMLVARTYPEAFYGMWNDPFDWQRMADQYFILPLEGYIADGWMPNLRSILQEYPSLTQDIEVDGHLYSLPSYNALDRERYEVLDAIYLNKQWMDTLGLSVPTTTDEFYQVLRAFSEGDPNGNGRDDEIPFSGVWESHTHGLWSMLGSFGVVDQFWYHSLIRDGQVISPNVQPEYREAIKYFRRLYQEGLLDPEFISQDYNMLAAKVRANEVGAWVGSPSPLGLLEIEPGDEESLWDLVYVVPPLEGPGGDTLWQRHRVGVRGKLEVTNKSRSPEAMLSWADQFYDEEWGLQLHFGPIGTGLVEHADGTFQTLSPPEDVDMSEWTFADGPKFLNSPGILDRVRRTPADDIRLSILDVYRPHLVEAIYPPISFAAADNRKTGGIFTDVKKLVDNKQVAWITGEADIDEEWEWYLAELEKIGIGELFDIYQRYYDEYLTRGGGW